MGRRQERWLLDGLAASRARWNVLAQQVFFAQLDSQSGDGQRFDMDAWDGYPACRDRIVDFISERNIENPIVLTGNVHGNWANEILADFDDPDSLSIGAEFVGTSITSGGDVFDTWPGADTMLAENPHVKFLAHVSSSCESS